MVTASLLWLYILQVFNTGILDLFTHVSHRYNIDRMCISQYL